VGSEGEVTWDGRIPGNEIAPMGIYILVARSFDLSGNNSVQKKAVFLTRKY
jgi:hypothetical protein